MLGSVPPEPIARRIVEINVRFLPFSRGHGALRVIHAPARLCTKEMLPCVREL
jgi:hypothetical protein